jgi:hypothetical protein
MSCVRRVLRTPADECDDVLEGFVGVEVRGRGDFVAEALDLEGVEDRANAVRERQGILASTAGYGAR